MILATLNGIAVMIAHTPEAAMSIPETIMIQPPLTAVLAKPTIVKQVSEKAPYAALVIGFAMWGARISQLRQGARPAPVTGSGTAPFAMDSDNYGADEPSTNGVESMPDTGPIWDELSTIRVG
jgi:hypothetical protein